MSFPKCCIFVSQLPALSDVGLQDTDLIELFSAARYLPPSHVFSFSFATCVTFNTLNRGEKKNSLDL